MAAGPAGAGEREVREDLVADGGPSTVARATIVRVPRAARGRREVQRPLPAARAAERVHDVLAVLVEGHLLATAPLARVVVQREIGAMPGDTAGEVAVVARPRLGQLPERDGAGQRRDRVAPRLAMADPDERRSELIGAQPDKRAALGQAVLIERQALRRPGR